MVKVKSLTPGYTDEQVTEILNGYSEDYGCPMDVIIPLYQMMPNEIKDGLVCAMEDWDLPADYGDYGLQHLVNVILA